MIKLIFFLCVSHYHVYADLKFRSARALGQYYPRALDLDLFLNLDVYSGLSLQTLVFYCE